MGSFLSHAGLKILLIELKIRPGELCEHMGGKYMDPSRNRPQYNMLRGFGVKIETTEEILKGLSELTLPLYGDEYKLAMVKMDGVTPPKIVKISDSD